MNVKYKFSIAIILMLSIIFIMGSFLPSYAEGSNADRSTMTADEWNDYVNDLYTIELTHSERNWTITKILVTVIRSFQIVMSGVALAVLAYAGIRTFVLSQQREVSNERILLRNAILVNVVVFGADAIITVIVELFT